MMVTILIETLKNVKNVLKIVKSVKIKIFVKVPSLAVLKSRLKKRATDSKQSVDLRLKTSYAEMKEARHYDYIVTNSNLFSSFKKLESIVLKELSKS